ncbi:MAG: hypothetical protein ABWY00_16495 [Dongiaceae bacterium]
MRNTYICPNCHEPQTMPDYVYLSRHKEWHHNCPCGVINLIQNEVVTGTGHYNLVGVAIGHWYQIQITTGR